MIEGRQVSLAQTLFGNWYSDPARMVIAALSSYLSYLLILIAFQLGGEAAQVSAVRQASIPVSIVLAALLLKEPRLLQRLVWGAFMLIGMTILAFGQS